MSDTKSLLKDQVVAPNKMINTIKLGLTRAIVTSDIFRLTYPTIKSESSRQVHRTLDQINIKVMSP